MLISIASQIVTSLADILFRDKTTPLGLPVEPEVNVIMAAPSSNGRFGGKASEIFIGEGALRFSRLSGDKTNLAFDTDSRFVRVSIWDLRWNGTAIPPASITAMIAATSSARPPTGISTGSFEHNPTFRSLSLASAANC